MRKLIAFCTLFVLLCSGCSNKKGNSIYHDTTQLTSLTNAYSIDEQQQKQDCKDGSLFCSVVFDGMDTLWDFNAEKDCTVDAYFRLEVTKGKAKLILITADGNIKTIVEKTEKSRQSDLTKMNLELLEGYNRIKLVAEENSQINLELQMEQGELHRIGF